MMTLILTVGNERGIYQSSDFQQTEPLTGKFVSDKPGSKQLDSAHGALQVKLSLTGVASIGTRKTMDWLTDEMKKLKQITNINAICEALVQRGNTELGSGQNNHGLLLMLAVGEVDRPFRVAEIANVDPETWAPRKEFKRTIRTTDEPFYLARGSGADSISDDEKRRLEALSRDTTKSPKQILNELAEINKDVGARSNGKVSAGCWVGSLYKDETYRSTISTMAWNSGGKEGYVPQIWNQQDLLESLKNIPQFDFSKAKIVQTGGGAVGRPPKKPA
jgi:hypothetical protein